MSVMCPQHGGHQHQPPGEAVPMSALAMLYVCLASCSSQIRALALPALLSLLVDPILSLVDTAYVGRGLGAISLAALGTAVFKQRYTVAIVFAVYNEPFDSQSVRRSSWGLRS